MSKMSKVGVTEKELVSGVEVTGTETDYSHPMFSSDEFMMYYYKVHKRRPQVLVLDTDLPSR